MGRSFKDIFLLVFPLTGLPFGVLTYYLLHFQTLGERGLWMAVGLGVACGLVFGIGIAYFVRSSEITVAVDPSIDVYTRIQLLLLRMGYRLDNQFQKVVTFKPTFRAGIFADHIRIELSPGVAKISGPVYHLDIIQAKLGV
ncbi:MAG TPA: hypothetical protein VHB73_05390 [Alphaproteobacteria bacterium]|nr:hypothetical protein [Alphaproteobacteria bacterium]